MMKSLLCLVSTLLLAACGFQPEREWPEPSPALWQVTSPEGNHGWLFGTVHSLPADVEWETDQIRAAFDASGILVLEIANLENSSSPSIFQDLSHTPDLPPILSRIDDEHRASLVELLGKAGYTQSDFHDVETWAAAMMISSAVRMGDPQNGVDRTLSAQARLLTELEGYEAQLLIFDQLSENAQADLLTGIAIEYTQQMRHEQLEAWIVGDVERFATTVESDLLIYPELAQAILINRNNNWIEQIIPMIDGGSEPFVAVGFAHMVTPMGLPAQFADRGYTVRRMQ